jgi:hypothetical protein
MSKVRDYLSEQRTLILKFSTDKLALYVRRELVELLDIEAGKFLVREFGKAIEG